MAVDKDKLNEEASYDRFCKIVLAWDYFRLLSRSKESDANGNEDGGDGSGLRQVKDTYKDVDDYLSTFEPLMFEEVKAQIVQGEDEVNECVMRLVMEYNEVGGFLLPAVTYAVEDETEKISQNDLLLLSKEEFKRDKLPTTYAFALVEHHQRNLLRIRMCLVEGTKHLSTDVVETSPRLQNMRAFITSPLKPEEKPLFSLKICSLSTIAREYHALRSISSLPFKDLILSVAHKNSGSEDQAWKISGPLHQFLAERLNESQVEAVDAGLSRKPFVLIQGPPGTGKTQTILALLSIILHATPAGMHSKGELRGAKCSTELHIQQKYNHWVRASPWLTSLNPRDLIMPVDGDDGFFPTTGNELKPEVVASSRRYRVRVLVCAPSNSALDEIVLRLLKHGINDENLRTYNPKVVRIGLKAHHSIQSVCMDYLVKQKLGESAASKANQGATAGDKDSIRSAVLEESVIVFSTLSFSGSAILNKINHGFDIVIIDEAAQAVEPATLVPLASGCKQVFLVGDPVQLPATVISSRAANFGYGMSLFERFQRAGYPVHMLKTQYRMHPQIRSFPSAEFYASALEDAEDIENKTSREWHQYRCFGPFAFFDIHEGKELKLSGSGSYENHDEVEFVLLTYHKLVSMYPELRSSSKLAIISPYRYQVKLFQDRFRETFGQESEKFVDIQTVDGFQGREKDVAIFSCVRASTVEGRGIGFLSDARRMNVGITRAKSTVLVVGCASTLRKDEHWNNLVESAEKRSLIFKVSKPYASFYSDANLELMKAGADDNQMAGEPEPDDVENHMMNNHDGGYDDQDGAADEDGDMDDGGNDDDD